MWAYANNVNFLTANANWHDYQSTGTGIYAGRRGALKTFVDSQVPQSKVLVAKVPIRLPSDDSTEIEMDSDMQSNPMADESSKSNTFKLRHDIAARYRSKVTPEYDKYVLQQDMKPFGIEFLDFSERTSHKGTVCNEGLCCHYDIDIRDNGAQDDNLVMSFFTKCIQMPL